MKYLGLTLLDHPKRPQQIVTRMQRPTNDQANEYALEERTRVILDQRRQMKLQPAWFPKLIGDWDNLALGRNLRDAI